MRTARRALPAFVRPWFQTKVPPLRRPLPQLCAMAKSAFYAVRNGKGGFSGVLRTWDECQKYTHGAKGVQYKKFATYSEAQTFANGTLALGASSKPISKSRTRPRSAPASSSSAGASTLMPKDMFAVYTDGACSKNGQRGARAGYGVYFGAGHPDNISEPLQGPATNQRAEMTAVLHAMRVAFQQKLVNTDTGLLIYTDSSYTLNGVTKWVDAWKKKRWKTSAGSDVKNRDLWEQLDSWRQKYDEAGVEYELQWVKGHANLPGNEAADRLAVAGAARLTQ